MSAPYATAKIKDAHNLVVIAVTRTPSKLLAYYVFVDAEIAEGTPFGRIMRNLALNVGKCLKPPATSALFAKGTVLRQRPY